jgi:hypothetical protein
VELLAILQILWRRRLSVAVGVVATVGLFLAIGTKPAPRSGLAWTRVVLDTQHSEIIHPDPIGADTLLWRVQMLADLLTNEHSIADIAQSAGIAPEQLAVTEPIKDTTAELGTPLPQRALEASAASILAPYVVTVEYGTSLPVISVRAVAPTRVQATRLAQAAIGIVEREGNQAGTAPRDPEATALQGLRTDVVSPLRSRDVLGSRGRAKKILACLLLLGLWCSVLAFAPPLPRRRRMTPSPQAG